MVRVFFVPPSIAACAGIVCHAIHVTAIAWMQRAARFGSGRRRQRYFHLHIAWWMIDWMIDCSLERLLALSTL